MPITITGEPAAEYDSCYDCGGSHAANNHLRQYRQLTSGWNLRTLCTRCRNASYDQCNECEQLAYAYQIVDGYCPNHLLQCTQCLSRESVSGNSLVCEDCGIYCEGCDDYLHPETEVYDGYCAAHENDRGPDDEQNGVRGYGHTHPQRWFGGPLPKDENRRRVGFYLGFELEITAEREDARPILQWEQDNNLAGFFDCKQDSSVAGFEIATQPFTPEFFEGLVNDGRLASFFDMLNANYPLDSDEEAVNHGLHVHIGRIAFLRDNVALAAFSYLIGQDNGAHLERIARRAPTGYCDRVPKPVTQAIMMSAGTSQRQRERLQQTAPYFGRSAINLHNSGTVEIRAFRSTRSAKELADAVRLVYVAADYARWLRSESRMRGVDPKRLAWAEFCRWVAQRRPQAFDSLAGVDAFGPKVQATPAIVPVHQGQEFSFEDEADDLPEEPRFVYVTATTPECGQSDCEQCPTREHSVLRAVRRNTGLLAV